jgi:hypothetical protein
MKLRTLTMHGHVAFGHAANRPRYRPTLRVRLRTRLHARSLDRSLAAGHPPEERAERALRASQLTAPGTRRTLARSLRGAVAEAERASLRVLSPTIAPDPAPTWGWRQGLLGLAERLEQPRPVNPCGVARAKLLLSDGAGPLYNRRACESLEDAIWSIAEGLELEPRPE